MYFRIPSLAEAEITGPISFFVTIGRSHPNLLDELYKTFDKRIVNRVMNIDPRTG